ncbi:adenylate kinase isoenzyme 5-like [Centropristis striata]|uniref:adenylate kinase isoenzyme 5-like n=1 Tax=Centropristis striata TaxID=184440 RepID=UPI0027E0ED1A|nr:adenylate kinase isoenzyme 5-like [Centropristis striata]
MSSREVKEYLSHHHVPQLLESLLTGLLYHHPEDPVSFLQSCLMSTRQLGGPEAVTWDTFIHLERQQQRPGPPKTASLLPITTSMTSRTKPGPPIKPPIPQRPLVPPLTPSVPPKTTALPPRIQALPLKTAPVPPIKPQKPLKPPIRPTLAQTSSPPSPLIKSSTVVPQGSCFPSLKPQTSALPLLTVQMSPINNKTPSGPPQTAPEPRHLPPVPPGPAETPPVQNFNTDVPGPGPSPPVRSLSIDSDSDMKESSGLLQEVSILPPQKHRPLIIFIIGGPGSGKGSQAARLAHCFNLRVVSLDELLRRQLLRHASPSRRWEVISEMMGHGELGTQEETISELKRQLIGQKDVTGFIVDGFPRDVHQALSFQEQIGCPDLVMLLLCSNQTLRCRLQQRATQLGLLGDNSHALRRRLETFQRDVVSISRYYRQLHLLTQVDADRQEVEVFTDVKSAVKERLPLLKDPSGPADVLALRTRESTSEQ